MIADFKSTGAMQTYLHHTVAIIGSGGGAFFGSFIGTLSNLTTVTEMSTPFVNLRALLYIHKKTDSGMYFYNGLAMVFFFGFSRVFF